MKIASLKIYEGNNIKRRKRIIKLSLDNTSWDEMIKYLKTYFRASYQLGFKEKLIGIDKDSDLFMIWVTYTEEEVSKFILSNIIYNLDNTERLVEKAGNLIKVGFLYDVVKMSRERGLPVIELSEDMFQLGYGKNSVILGRNYQSYENAKEVELSRNRKNLWQRLRYSHIPKVDGRVLYSMEEIKDVKAFKYPINIRNIDKINEIKITISDYEELNRVLDNMMKMYTRAFVYSENVKYRVICYKGLPGVLLKKEDKYRLIEISDKSLEILEIADTLEKLKLFCQNVYNNIPIEFMYIDLQESDELKTVDLGCVFDIGEEMGDAKFRVIDYFINSIINDGVGLIPIIAVTGTNGKTTTARLSNYILNKLGFKSALTSTGGIFVGSEKIKAGDTTGFLSAREALTNKEVEAAVLETARGGIYRNGLGYEKAAAAVITSLSEDHIGMDGIRDIKDLVNIKTVILEELAANGKVIIKAQKELLENIKERRNVCLFSIDKNSYIEEHIKNGCEAFYIDDEFISWNINGIEKKLINVKDIPFTHRGHSRGNILNIMASIAAVSSFYGNIEEIVHTLIDLQCDLSFNPGRQNILDFEKFKVILDYGHNSEAFREVFSIAKSLHPSRLTGIIAAAGDRMDKYISELGTIASEYCDNIIIREQADLRGRRPGETASLIKEGAISGGFSENNLIVIYKEEDAIDYAMENAQQGEVIVLFTQCLDVVIPVINKFMEIKGKAPIGKGIDFSH